MDRFADRPLRCWIALGSLIKLDFVFVIMSMKSVLVEELDRISLSKSEILGLRRVANDLVKKLKEGVKNENFEQVFWCFCCLIP